MRSGRAVWPHRSLGEVKPAVVCSCIIVAYRVCVCVFVHCGASCACVCVCGCACVCTPVLRLSNLWGRALCRFTANLTAVIVADGPALVSLLNAAFSHPAPVSPNCHVTDNAVASPRLHSGVKIHCRPSPQCGLTVRSPRSSGVGSWFPLRCPCYSSLHSSLLNPTPHQTHPTPPHPTQDTQTLFYPPAVFHGWSLSVVG